MIKPWWKEKKHMWIMAIVLASATFTFDNTVREIFLQLSHPLITYVMSGFSHLATLLIVLVGITSLFLIEEKKTRWMKVIWLSFATTFVMTAVLKLIMGRERPIADFAGLGFLANAFPSAHAALAFALIPVLDREFPVLKWFWITFAVMVAASRLYLDVHYFSDVVWGALLGYAIGTWFVRWEEKR